MEELFDLREDPDETTNLAKHPEYQKKTTELRNTLQKWMQETLDLGLLPEAEMHRLSDSQSPREYALQHKKLFTHLGDVAFHSMDEQHGYSIPDLLKLANDPSSAIRFWAVRGLAIRSSSDMRRMRALMKASKDESPSVAVAACDGILSQENSHERQMGLKRLMELADVNRHGHYAAVAALNVLDMSADLDAAERKQLANLPRQAKNPPARLGKYVGKLIDHATTKE